MRDPGVIVLAQYLRHIAAQLQAGGVPVARWLALNGLDEARLGDPSLVVTFPLFRRLLLDALRLADEPALGLFVGERLLASTHGMVGYAVVNSGTVAQALDVCERFSRLRTSLVTMRHELRGGDVRVRFAETRPLGELQRPILEAVMLSIANVFAAISMGGARPRYAAFAGAAPAYRALAQQLFGCPVRYGQTWSGFVLPRAALDLPCKLADPDAFREAAAVCQRELERLVADESLAGRVRRLILERHEGVPSLTVTARLLHMTERTLHRRLVAEGTSFRQLLAEVRHALALEHLGSPRLGMAELAYLLGYSDLSNFRRAFKRWQGVAPSTYRARQLRRRAPVRK